MKEKDFNDLPCLEEQDTQVLTDNHELHQPDLNSNLDEFNPLLVQRKREKGKEKEVNAESNFHPSTSSAPSTKTRKGLDLDESFKRALLDQLPQGYWLGVAYGEGDCFFDALAQWINKINSTDANTDKYLRTLCHEFYQENKKLAADLDLADSGEKEKELDEDQYAKHEYAYSKIQYTAGECERLFNKDICIWGRPWVEGIMLCRKLNLESICIIEVFKDLETDNPVISYHLIKPSGYKSSISEKEGIDLIETGNTPILVNVQGKLHFVPLWKK